MKQKTISLSAFLIVLLAIICAGMLVMRGMDRTKEYQAEVIDGLQTDYFAAAANVSRMQQELALQDTDSYIRSTAKELYGYLMPGEIRFVVINPEVLYDAPEEAVAMMQETEETE